MPEHFSIEDDSRPAKADGSFDVGAFQQARERILAKYRPHFARGPAASFVSSLIAVAEPPEYLTQELWSSFVDDMVALSRAKLLDDIATSFGQLVDHMRQSAPVAPIAVIRMLDPVVHQLADVEHKAWRTGRVARQPSTVEPLFDFGFFEANGEWPEQGLAPRAEVQGVY